MKITDIKTFVVGNPWKNWVFLKVYTDEGLTGLGEATGGLATKPHVADIEELARHAIGEDPRNPSAIYHKMYKKRFLVPTLAMSGIEIACWDILAKSLSVPLWQFFGGAHRKTLRVYANGWYRGPRDPSFFAERAAELVSQGYTALKFDPFGGAYLRMDSSSRRLAVSIIAAVRDAVGPDVDLLIEGHDRFSVSEALTIAHQIAEYSPMLFETPVNSLDIEATALVAKSSPVPIAVGERYGRLGEFLQLLSHRTVDIIQPEVMHLGLGNHLKACALAEAADAVVASHQAQSPVCTALNAHVHASIPNFLIQENFDDGADPWTWDLLAGVPRVERGYLTVSDDPGIGVELDEVVAVQHPYSEKHFLRLFEEGWETRRPQ
ncbi:MAG: mandelate racemase/muconate lactonizing enzyme family protein [Spirochaetaceae bacterium]|nr:MAG: mandelate racemase/muconate lactonizing enzyme family protein [Spirochaetaceae bacterium]